MLVDLNTYKTLLGLPLTASAIDSQLISLLGVADQLVKSYVQRDLEETSYTEYYSGNNQVRITLKQTPVTVITSVSLDNSGYFGERAGSFGSPSLLTEGTDFVLDRQQGGTLSKSGILFRIGTVWPVVTRVSRLGRLSPDQGPSYGNIKVVYTAGYNPVPQDLKLAVVLFVSTLRRTIPVGQTLVSERLGAYAYQLLHVESKKNPDLASVERVLARYQESGW